MLYTHDWLLAFCHATRNLPRDLQQKIFDQLCEEYVPPTPEAPRKRR